MNAGQALLRVRAQAKLVHELGERLREAAPGALPGQRLDGMPRGRGGVPGGLEVQVEKRDSLLRILQREGALLRRYERAARREMDGMKPEWYAFCALYYIGGLSVADTAQAIDRSERQCLRYKRDIEESGGKCQLAQNSATVV